MDKGTLKLTCPELASLYAEHPSFDILNYDFFQTKDLKNDNSPLTDPAVVEKLKSYQRILRICDEEAVAEKLISSGFHSAHRITSVSAYQFMQECKEKMGIEAGQAERVYKKAVDVRQRTSLLFYNLRDVASPFYKATLSANTRKELEERYSGIPGYTDLFGSMDYCTFPEARSILSPAAYFVDLMRLAEEYISAPNIENLSKLGLSLKVRRPDLFEIPLDAEHADNLVPYLQIVNNVIGYKLSKDKGEDALKHLATALYPFNAPYNKPLTQIREYLKHFHIHLSEIYQIYHAKAVAVACARLELSPEQYRQLTTPDASPESLTKSYGCAITATSLNQLNRAEFFAVQTALPSVEAVRKLIYEQFSTTEIESGILLKQLFINGTNPEQCVRLSVNKADPQNEYLQIDHLTAGALERMNRMIRVANAVGWEYAEVDCALRLVTLKEINEQAIKLIAGIAALCRQFKTEVQAVAAFFGNMNTLGMGSNAIPYNLFDKVYNYPIPFYSIDNNHRNEPYHPVYEGNPTYQSAIVTWDMNDKADDRVGAESQKNAQIRSRLVGILGVSDDQLSILGRRVSSIMGLKSNEIPMSVPVMTLLYRFAKQASLLGLSMEEFADLMDLMKIEQADSLESFEMLVRILNWMKESNVNIHDLKFITTGVINKFVNSLYTEEEIRMLLQKLWEQSQNLLVTTQTFANEELRESAAACIYRQLLTAEVVNSYGVYQSIAASYTFAMASELIKLLEGSFITELINPDASKSVFKQLTDNEILLKGYLADSFTEQTDLSFLFSGDKRQLEKTEEVRNVLLAVKELITFVALEKNSFISAVITAEQSLMIYNKLVSKGVITPQGTLPDPVTAETDLSFLSSEAQCSEVMIDHVAQMLRERSLHIASIVANIDNQRIQQSNSMIELLSGGYHVDTDLLETSLAFSSAITGITDCVVLLLKPLRAPDPLSNEVLVLLRHLSQILYVAQKLCLRASEMDSIRRMPSIYGETEISEGYAFSINTLQNLYNLKKIQSEFNDINDAFLSYFYLSVGKETKNNLLSSITGWDAEQIAFLADKYMPGRECAASVADIYWLKKAFDQAAVLGVDVYFVNRYAALAELSVSDAGWQTYTDLSDSLYDIVYADYESDEWTEINERISGPVLESERNVLVDYLIWDLSENYPSIRSAEDLYQFLLIDVKMSGVSQTSYIKEGIGAVQLYIQRCRMNLEQGVDKLNIPDHWWEWMCSYRVWEANRKVYLYPENYIDPNLRGNKSSVFEELKDQLMQGEVTDANVQNLYMDYFDKLGKLSKLTIAGTYYCRMKDPVWNDCQCLWTFGRTDESPYIYYYRRAIRVNKDWSWEAWKKIDISIGGDSVTPLYAMDKLYLFWVEKHEVSNSTMINGNSTENNIVKATVKYSYYNFNGEWLQPQTLKDEFVASCRPDDYLEMINSYLLSMNMKLDQGNLFWHKPFAIRIPSVADIPETVYVTYGDCPSLPPKGTARPPKPSSSPIADVTEFNDNLCDTINRAVSLTTNQSSGYVCLLPSSILSATTKNDDVLINVLNDTGNQQKSYRGYMDADKKELLITQTENAIYDNYMGDCDFKTIPIKSGIANTLSLIKNINIRLARVTMVKNMPGWFIFDNGDEAFLVSSSDAEISTIDNIVYVNHREENNVIKVDLLCSDYTTGKINFADLKFSFYRLATQVIQQLSWKIFAGGVDHLLTIESQQSQELSFSRFYEGRKPPTVIPPASDKMDFEGAYGLYFWEIFFYTPLLIADSLSENQRFSEAQKWYHFLFNPTTRQTVDSSNPNDRYWGFLPLWGQTVEDLEKILTDSKQIAIYNNDPFDPDAIAHLRSTAFQKSLVMKYIDNLIKWADNLFTQDTWESIVEATMLYVMAKELLGKRPQDRGVGKLEKTTTFQNIMDTYGDHIPEFLIQLENVVKASEHRILIQNKPYNDIESYFCIPENEKFISYWNTIDDRLFKIRHCMNIEGQVRQLSLVESPIDPLELIRLVSGGGSVNISKVIASLEPQVPEYRFSYVMAQAKNVTASLIQMGNSLLAALEKRDNERLLMLRQTQEKAILNLTLRIKEEQKEQAGINLSALSENLRSATKRYDHYSRLIDTGLNPQEVLHLQATLMAQAMSTVGSIMKMSSSLAHLIPNVGSPFAMTYGGVQIGESLNAVGSYFDFLAGQSGFIGNLSLTMAGYQRRQEDWTLQKQIAECDVANINYQMESARIAQLIAEREIEMQKKQTAQNEETEAFYRTKFSNEELYSWIVNKLSSLYFQAYTLAYSLAMAAEKAYRYERATNEKFIEYGYWDSLRKGLYAGEALQLSLNQLEYAYMNSGKRGLEIQKSISLLQQDPVELMNLKETGVCHFNLTEKMFDMDYPGHYCRRLKAISITIPALIGPYQQVKATLVQLSNKVILKQDLNAVSYLLGCENATNPDNAVLRSNWRTNQQIALSAGVNDFGLFQLNFGDERYLPFEGTGAVSTWKFEMSKTTNTIDFDSISDIIIQLHYEAKAGDESFKKAVAALPEVKSFTGYQLIDLKQSCFEQWSAFMKSPKGEYSQMEIEIGAHRFRRNLSNLEITDVSIALEWEEGVVCESDFNLLLTVDGQQMKFTFNKNNMIDNKSLPDRVNEYFGKWLLATDDSPIQGVKSICLLINYRGSID